MLSSRSETVLFLYSGSNELVHMRLVFIFDSCRLTFENTLKILQCLLIRNKFTIMSKVAHGN